LAFIDLSYKTITYIRINLRCALASRDSDITIREGYMRLSPNIRFSHHALLRCLQTRTLIPMAAHHNNATHNQEMSLIFNVNTAAA
jgi:hypothetical protein